MKLSRFLALSLSLGVLVSLALSTSSCGFVYQVVGKDKLNQGILKYNQGKPDEAMKYFDQSIKLGNELPAETLKQINKERSAIVSLVPSAK